MLPSADADQMVVSVKTADDRRFLMAYARTGSGARWRTIVEVPFARWPWKLVAPRPEERSLAFPPEIALQPITGSRPLVRIVAVPLNAARTIVCGGVRGFSRSGLPLYEACVAVKDAHPERPHLLGAALLR